MAVEVNRLQTWVRSFKEPAAFALTVTVNLTANITKVVVLHTGMYSYMRGGHWDKAGEEYGRVLALLLGAVPLTITVNEDELNPEHIAPVDPGMTLF